MWRESNFGGGENGRCPSDTLFFAKRPNDPNCVVLCELRIREYLKGPTAASLQRLSTAIDKEVQACQSDDRFWIKMQKIVRSLSEVVTPSISKEKPRPGEEGDRGS
jgi:hypothetical protein